MWPYGGDGNGFGRPAGLGGPCSLIVAATRRDAGASGRDHRLWAYSGQWYGHGPPEGLGDGRRSAAVRRGMKGLGGPGAGWAFLSLLTAWSRQVLPLKADERASRPCISTGRVGHAELTLHRPLPPSRNRQRGSDQNGASLSRPSQPRDEFPQVSPFRFRFPGPRLHDHARPRTRRDATCKTPCT